MSADGTKVSDQEILEWVERHDLRVSSATDARAAFEDARTLHLLAAVSRPAEARGEAVAWAVVGRDAGLMRVEGDKAAADAWCVQLAPGWADGDSWRVQPLYTHPAPSGGEADVDSDEFRDNCALQVICRAFDNWEPVYERWLAYDKTQWLWWGRALGAFLRREIAAAPRPETGEVSEAMVADAMMAFWGWDVNEEISETSRRQLRDNFLGGGIDKRDSTYVALRRALRAALAARERA